MRSLKRKLTKSRTNVILTGTLGGIAEYFGIDATIVRIIFVLITFGAAFSPILLYIIMALIIPSGRSNSRRDDYGHENPYYRSNSYGSQKKERKEAEKVDDDDWSDF